MVSDFEKLLIEGNLKFQGKAKENPEMHSIDQKIPKYPIVFLTCMDPRIDIYRIFQLNPGDVFILRNAGNIYTIDMMRSILITIYKYNIKYIIVLGHTDCGMTKIDIKRLREKLPNEFLKRLSINYSDLLSKLFDFFKPFENEISNVIKQINSLQDIRRFFPEIEIIGMLYDTQTGWVFKQENFRDLLIKENHFKIYKGLLYEKDRKLAEFLNSSKIVKKPERLADEIQGSGSKSEEETVLQEIANTSFKNNREQILDDHENIGIQIKMPKIQVPKIKMPKITIYKPQIKKPVKKEKKS
ncbi:MAG: carbonic anhydrase [Candidatus Odinarchaeota archaeon]